MDKKRKANKFNILFVALIVIAGLLLMYTGNDALVLATEKKEGILTAEQVQVSPSLTVVKLKKVLQASIYAACETFLLRNEL